MNKYERIAKTEDRLRQAMNEAGKKQADLVRETGLDRSAISNYLAGKYEPKQTAIGKMAAVLGVSEMWLWGYDVPKERSSENGFKETQKKNDILADITFKLFEDEELFEIMEKISKLGFEQRKAVKSVVDAFEVTEK